MADIRTHYDNLKVARNAPVSVIKAAYKALCQTYHPDKFEGSNDQAERIMKIINASYSALIDPVKRAAHDDWIHEQELKAEQQSKNARFGETGKATEQQYYQSQYKQPDTPKTEARPQSVKDKPQASAGSTLDKLVAFIILIVTVLLTLLFLLDSLSQNTNDQSSYPQTAEQSFQATQDSQSVMPSTQIPTAPDMTIQLAPETDNAQMQEQAIVKQAQTSNPSSEVKIPVLSAKRARKQAAAILKEKNLTLPKLKQAYDLYQVTLNKDPRNPEALRGINIIANKINALESGQKY